MSETFDQKPFISSRRPWVSNGPRPVHYTIDLDLLKKRRDKLSGVGTDPRDGTTQPTEDSTTQPAEDSDLAMWGATSDVPGDEQARSTPTRDALTTYVQNWLATLGTDECQAGGASPASLAAEGPREEGEEGCDTFDLSFFGDGPV